MPDEDAAGFDDIVDIADYQPNGSFERQLRDYKIKLAVAAVRENNGNKTLAARSLCISRAYLHRLIRLAEPEPSSRSMRNATCASPPRKQPEKARALLRCTSKLCSALKGTACSCGFSFSRPDSIAYLREIVDLPRG